MADSKKKSRIVPKKTPIPEQDPAKRRRNFTEVALGYPDDLALQEARRCLQCRKPKCIEGCPVNVPIPQFIDAVGEGDFQKAIDIIKEKN
ncbi:MAG TPA: dihydropyrimidine dehydrogenase, partial [Nitrospirae bacterium]|nr:dihydropyrimidine dehydrogenase [Nitrospirota bacterium]